MTYEMLPFAAHTNMWALWIFIPVFLYSLFGIIACWNDGVILPLISTAMSIGGIVGVLVTYVPTGTQKLFCAKEHSVVTIESINGIKYTSHDKKICDEFKTYVAVDDKWKEVLK
jgi:hypothetical protein